MLPQEIEILEQRAQGKAGPNRMGHKLKRWHGWLNTDKAAQAEANIKAIDDPYAARALAK